MDLKRSVSYGKPVSDLKKKESLYNLFKPPKHDTNYFYYTEVYKDFICRR